jgi:hypothetical protein
VFVISVSTQQGVQVEATMLNPSKHFIIKYVRAHNWELFFFPFSYSANLTPKVSVIMLQLAATTVPLNQNLAAGVGI